MDLLNDKTVQMVIAAVLVLLLLLIVLAVWRSFSPRMGGRRGQRLGITEYLELDKTRRLVLLRRDNVEHLIMIGGPQDVVIEPSITVASVAASYAPQTTAPDPGSARPAPRAPVFAERKPPPLRPVESPAIPLTRRPDDQEP